MQRYQFAKIAVRNQEVIATSLANLLMTERAHAAQWWTVMNEMLLNKELPMHLVSKGVGTAVEHEQHNAARRAVNKVLFGLVDLYDGDSPTARDFDLQEMIDLLEAERTHALRWWSAMDRMRANGQLPSWVSAMSLGHGPDLDRWHAKVEVVNVLLFGRLDVRSMARLTQ